MSQILITPDLLNNLKYDMETLNVGDKKSPAVTPAGMMGSKEPTVMIVFANSDINAALYHLGKSLEAPFENKAIATLLVQESIKKDFIAKLKQQIKPYAVQDNYLSNTQFVNAVKMATKLNAEIIGVNSSDIVGPILVCDFTHDQFGGCEATGLVTLHTFRTAKEAINLVSKETINFSHASIWHENHAYAYELVAELKMKNFYINCYHVPTAMLDESASQGKSFVVMDKSYHYETVPCNGIQKSIVFPYGSIFAN